MKKVVFLSIVFIFALSITAFGFRGNQNARPSHGLGFATRTDATGKCPYLVGVGRFGKGDLNECPAFPKEDCGSGKAKNVVYASALRAEDDGSFLVKYAVLGEQDQDHLPVCECPHCADAGECICDVNKCGCAHCQSVREGRSALGEETADSSIEKPYAPKQGICPTCGMPWDEDGKCEMDNVSKKEFAEQAFKMIQEYNLPPSAYIFKEVSGPYETAIPEGIMALGNLQQGAYGLKWEDGVFAAFLNDPTETPGSKLKSAVGVRTTLTEDNLPRLPEGYSFKDYDAMKAVGFEVKGEYGSPQVTAYWWPLVDYVTLHRYEWAGPAIEVYLDDPGLVPKSECRTRLLVPVKMESSDAIADDGAGMATMPFDKKKQACPCFKGAECECAGGCGCPHCSGM